MGGAGAATGYEQHNPKLTSTQRSSGAKMATVAANGHCGSHRSLLRGSRFHPLPHVKLQPLQLVYWSLCGLFGWHRLRKLCAKQPSSKQGIGSDGEGHSWSHPMPDFHSTPCPVLPLYIFPNLNHLTVVWH